MSKKDRKKKKKSKEEKDKKKEEKHKDSKDSSKDGKYEYDWDAHNARIAAREPYRYRDGVTGSSRSAATQPPKPVEPSKPFKLKK